MHIYGVPLHYMDPSMLFFIILVFESGFLYAAQVDLAYAVKSICLRLLN